jgi:hypothetical protein
MTVATEAPQDTVARLFMEHKGYRVRPFEIDKLPDIPCWYYYYDLPDGRLELEVFFDARKQDWITTVTSFVAA